MYGIIYTVPHAEVVEWQTQQTQNLPQQCVRVQVPSSAPRAVSARPRFALPLVNSLTSYGTEVYCRESHIVTNATFLFSSRSAVYAVARKLGGEPPRAIHAAARNLAYFLWDGSLYSYSKKNIVLKDPQDSLAAIHEAAIERDPQANVDDLKKQLKEVIADVIARPNMFKKPKAPNLTELVKDNVEYKYKTIGEAFIGEKNKIKERRDLQAMLNGIKKAGDLVTMCDKIHQETLNATSASAKMELNEVNKRMGLPENNNNVAQKTVHRNNERQFGK